MDDHRHDPGPSRRGTGRGAAGGGRTQSAHSWQRDQATGAASGNGSEHRGQGRSSSRGRPHIPRDNRDQHNFTRDTHGQQHGDSNNQRRHHTRNNFLDLKRLEEIANSDSIVSNWKDVIVMIESPIDIPDVFVLTLEIIAKVCRTSFDETKSRLLLDVCNSNFIMSFTRYLVDLPYVQSKTSNNMYWKNKESQETFWGNFVAFCECVVNILPSVAMNKCRSLVEATTMCLDDLKTQHGFALSEQNNIKLKELKERLMDFKKRNEKAIKTSKGFKKDANEAPPPEDFRELSITPTSEDLLLTESFLRPNVVTGGYEDVEHYLDVQFRLLRENCFGPLRGLSQYLRDQTKKRYDHIRVVRHVKFLKPYVSRTKDKTRVGSLVQVDAPTAHVFQRTNWSTSKMFTFGRLVLFTKDNCRSIVVASILDRDESYLAQGMIPVCILGQGFNAQLYNDNMYTMIESEVNFEHYYHVLKVLKDPTFAQDLPMKQYIVDVIPNHQPPKYLTADTVLAVDTVHRQRQHQQIQTDKKDFDLAVLQEETWPNNNELSFDDSQLDAYKLCLSHEFAVVDGPPGTGKTYLGIQIAKTLFENYEKQEGCLMLIICHTNHALDQFLEGLLGFTESIVRIGGQPRSEAMKRINLTELRRHIVLSGANRALNDRQLKLQLAISKFQKVLIALDVYLHGVIRCNQIEDRVLELRYLCDYYKRNGLKESCDPLYFWLFEHVQEYRTDDIDHLFENTTDNIFVMQEKENRNPTGAGVALDDQDIDGPDNKAFRKEISSFNVEDIITQMKQAVAQYNLIQDDALRRKIRTSLQIMNSYKMMFHEMSSHRQRRTNIKIEPNTNFAQIPTIDRWSIYLAWICRFTANAINTAGEMQEEVSVASESYEEARDTHVLTNKQILGITTSATAKMRKLLKTLNPPIVIVEEAAEVFEQHIITSLPEGCQHLILIGDQQQIRPSVSHIKLAKHFRLEVSLFERMVTNGINSRRLSVQHRMRPEIAALICPHIYKDIENHPSVYDFPDVKGMTKNLFFFNHDFKEEVMKNNMSRSNRREADVALGLAHYLLQQGYRPEDVTVLAAYKRQIIYLRKQSEKYSYLRGIKMSVADNYQGEESKIIVLSLVRSNDENDIGYLGTASKVCGALSRAQHGLYLIGNMETLKGNSELWRNIAVTLENGGSLGTELTLRCQAHGDPTTIEKLEDFEKAPEGGCLRNCGTHLPKCGHKCLLLCHGYDREHITPATRCPRPCERIQCGHGHACPRRCAEECAPCSRQVLSKLPCGHDMEMLCHQEQEQPKQKCPVLVDVTFPDCKHQMRMICHENMESVRCPKQCDGRLKCGHSCTKRCHVNDDPTHEEYECTKPCAKAKDKCRAELVGDRGEHQCLRTCSDKCDVCDVRVIRKRATCEHQVATQCHIDPDTVACSKNCSRALPCGHRCNKLCADLCGDCEQMVMKTIPDCNHEVTTMCRTEPARELCAQRCERTMSCGHQCTGPCNAACRPAACAAPSPRPPPPAPCGHAAPVPCHVAALPAAELSAELLLDACTAPCQVELACGHVCGGTCATCCQGRLHVPCQQPCSRPNICGHECAEPCNQICPPCTRQCEVKCKHSQCIGLCGAPCTPCMEPCGRVCPHGACTARCGEPCSRPPCPAPCPGRLPCGHPCRGLCGEPCPPACHVCSPDDFPTDFLGDAFDDTDRFVLLQDCGHILEAEHMDRLMMEDSEQVKICCCPFCRKPIINTGRYKDLVNATFNNEINPIKEKVYGTPQNIRATWNKLVADLRSYRAKHNHLLRENQLLRTVFLYLVSVLEPASVSKLQLDMELVCLDVLGMMSECWESFRAARTAELEPQMEKQLQLLCKIFPLKTDSSLLKISEQQQNDVKLEMKRLNAIVQLAKLTSHEAYNRTKRSPAVSDAHKTANAVIFKPALFKENETMDALEKLQLAIKVSGVVTKQERDLIVKAIGLKQGHWYKCPNGHFYCIANCGGAMEVSRCMECGASVGGRGHVLVAGNVAAPEVLEA